MQVEDRETSTGGAAPAGAPPRSPRRRSLTRLQAALAKGTRPVRPGPLDAFKLARRRWLAGERIDMSALARELGINRVTLYRWVGSREQLLVEVIWSLSERTLTDLDASAEERGAERIVRVVSSFIDAVNTNPGMQHWLHAEGESAMRLLTRYAPGYQPRLVGWIAGLLRREVDSDGFELPAEVGEVAFVLEQLIESYVYLDLITGEEPEPGRAEPILRMLLRRA